MSSSPRMIVLGDWGTSNCRLRLYEEKGGNWYERDRRTAPGVKFTKDPQRTFFDVVTDWIETFGAAEVYLCGMIGSNIGWQDVSYLECPVSFDDIAARTRNFVAKDLAVHIVPGLHCKNFVDAPDVMRGEETQIIGLCAGSEADASQSLFCLPGTHTKWVISCDQRIEVFQTSPTGELFEIINQHSTLMASRNESDFDEAGFQDGLEFSCRHHSVGLLNQLFSVRSKSLLGEIEMGQVRSYLSGILIGSEIQGIVNSQAYDVEKLGVSLVSSGMLAKSYSEALNHWGIRFATTDGEEAAFAGLKCIATNRSHQDV